jgi:hypothetical protein
MAANPTSLAELRGIQPGPRESQLPAVSMGFANLASFELLQRGAKLMASSSLVPAQFQGNVANCTIALNMATRMGADPLMVMQNLYIVHGRPGWSSQFLIACFNQCGRFSSIRYEFVGKEGTDNWGCRAWALEVATKERIQSSLITLALAKKEGWYGKKDSKWQSIPEHMLMLRSAAWLVRTHAPEIAMGLQTREELVDVIDVTPGTDGVYEMSTKSGGIVIDDAAAEAPANETVPGLSFKELEGAILDATSVEHLNEIMRQVPTLLDEGERAELAAMVAVRRAEFEGE